jgi:hypothetical protein
MGHHHHHHHPKVASSTGGHKWERRRIEAALANTMEM